MYKIKLQHFEGPLDLLLFFIKRDEIDIYDIPISNITQSFMEYLHIIKQLDLETAGDFILMASTLMQIKVKMLLPREIDEEGEEIDPRSDLVNALLEYKRYKETTEEFAFLEQRQQNIYYRGYFDADEKESPPELDTLLKNITIYDLMKAFKRAIDNRPKETFHQVKRLNFTIDQQSIYIEEKLKVSDKIPFFELVNGMVEKLKVVVTFIAVLEMIKIGKIGLRESANFNDFEIYRVTNE